MPDEFSSSHSRSSSTTEPMFFTASDTTGMSETTGISEVTGTNEVTRTSEQTGASEVTGIHGLTGIGGVTGMSEVTGTNEVTGMSEVTGMNEIAVTSEMEERMSSSPEIPVQSTVVILTDKKPSATATVTDSTVASSTTPELCYIIKCPWNDTSRPTPSTYSPCRGAISNHSLK